MSKTNNDFEKNLLRLQEISQLLEKEDITLDEASNLYVEGMELSKKCKKYLDEKKLIVEEIED